ncbi:biotin/lipoyl-binding protein [Carboxylicivirga mesophila]|uniref:Biotin/lipoyl-binding protein n=1 Tax=Carboxylicivirga mesophila TaxID=1166478 RepID=A0ABS5KD28_9BACT|nr:acetyl-CoA carboxylase biotin carboxyl carrier protein subunit [Carboxylicivirga mesophila]MBS2212253.1 biotin/lipoyl-binding protein [Carboxylicivirga mesophila]
MKKFSFTIRGNKYDVHLKDLDENIAQLDVNGTQYEVEIHQEVAKKSAKTPKLVRKEIQRKPGEGFITKNAGGGAIKVNAPLPGNIFKVLVKEGDAVKKGDVLLVMEAMKMENNVLAEKDGTVTSVKVSVGDAVLQNDVLIEMAQ